MIPIAEPDLNGNEHLYLTECIKKGQISSKGQFVSEFEKKFANYLRVNYCISTSNGTTALHLALVALNIKNGDEVIVPNLTFISTANVVKYVGAKPVLVDVNLEDCNIDPDEIKKKITLKTKAVIIVHLYGKVCNMDQILSIARENNLKVIEDCAEAIGAEFNGRKVGSLGDIGCFSFFGNKIITTGEGGMCATNDSFIADKIDVLKNHGMSREKRYWHSVLGFNFRMTNLQAAVGLAQLERIELFLKKRQKLSNWYDCFLKNVKGIRIFNSNSYAKNVCWLYSVLVEDDYGLERDDLIKLLDSHGIETRPFFYPLNEMPIYHSSENFPNSLELSKKGLSLPSSTFLSEKNVEFITKIIKEKAGTFK